MKNKDKNILRDFYILWFTQSISQLGSSSTAFALTLWLYERTGSALSTATLTICSYAPYVVLSIFAGALTDRLDKKGTMLVCDTVSAASTVAVFLLYRTGTLAAWHLYAINMISGLMNTVQQPASEVTMTLIVPKEKYQKASALQSLSRSVVSILKPLIASALYSFAGLKAVIAVDLTSFAVAFSALAVFIKIPRTKKQNGRSTISLAKEGLKFLKETSLVLTLILFMSGVNLVASAFDAILPSYVIPNPKGGSIMLGIVTSAAGVAMIAGSLIVSVLPKPKDRVKVVYLTMQVSLSAEHFLLAFSREPAVWCIGQVIGWILVPVMSANLDVILRNSIPVDLQGRVYACRNTLQFFTIPAGLFWGGIMVDKVCEPFMNAHADSHVLGTLFGSGKGSGAAIMMFLPGIFGTVLCAVARIRLRKFQYKED